jgi:hypothetical protein
MKRIRIEKRKVRSEPLVAGGPSARPTRPRHRSSEGGRVGRRLPVVEAGRPSSAEQGTEQRMTTSAIETEASSGRSERRVIHLLPITAERRSFRAPTSRGSEGPQDEPVPIGRGAIAWAARTLRRYEMPPGEIGAVLAADNPELVRRYMELHRERLEERLAYRLRALTGLERLLVQAIFTPRESTADTRLAILERDGENDAVDL